MNKIKWVVSMLFVVLLITPGYAITLRSGDALEIAENEVLMMILFSLPKASILRERLMEMFVHLHGMLK